MCTAQSLQKVESCLCKLSLNVSSATRDYKSILKNNIVELHGFYTLIAPVSCAQPVVSSVQFIQVNVRRKIANKISISKVICGDDGVTST